MILEGKCVGGPYNGRYASDSKGWFVVSKPRGKGERLLLDGTYRWVQPKRRNGFWQWDEAAPGTPWPKDEET